MTVHIYTPIKELTRVGKMTSQRLAKLDIIFVKDLLGHYPSRWEDYSQILTAANLREGATGSFFGKISSIKTSKTPRRQMNLTEAYLEDDAGQIKIIWFNQAFLEKTLKEGDKIALAGKVERDYSGWVIKNPQYEKWVAGGQTVHTARLVPIYPTTANITQKQIRFLLQQALPAVDELIDLIPPTVRRATKLLEKTESVKRIHFPKNRSDAEQASRRLKFEELFLIQLATQKARLSLEKYQAPVIAFNQAKTRQLVKSLPFELTADQRRAAWQILLDLQKNKPMNRLLQGEVGSGKTVVAAIAALNAAESGWQTAIMAPTEILAFQHFNTIAEIFPDKPIALLTSKYARITDDAAGGVLDTPSPFPASSAGHAPRRMPGRQGEGRSGGLRDEKITRNDIKKMISQGDVAIIIGTHAIIQKDVEFARLGLVVVDEQHRFGVAQRQNLKVKNQKSGQMVPHFLSMTATPIPRSLALTLYGDLDISTIRTMPAERKPILTKIVPESGRREANEFIRQKIKAGEQAFVICPLVEESDALGVKAATAEYEKLKKNIFPDLKIGLVHGRLAAKEKEEVMRSFRGGESDILVATAVVEVGVDVPGATMMLIEGAERFGFSQLHQFRGRIGRNDKQAYCFLFTETSSPSTLQRLQSFVRAKDGFEIAELDLAWRGPGALFGIEQSGYLSDLKIAKLTDTELIAETKKYAAQILEQDPELRDCPQLKTELENKQKIFHLE